MSFLSIFTQISWSRVEISTLILLLSSFTVNATTQNTSFNYDAQLFSITNIKERIVPIDMDGDGLKDLLCSNESSISVYFQRKEGIPSAGAFNFEQPDLIMDLPGSAVGWDVDYASTKNSDKIHTGKRLVAIVDGKSVMAWSIHNRSFSDPMTLLEELPGYLPKGAYPLNFIEDIDEDGLTDIIVPGYGRLHLYMQDVKGNYKGDILVESSISVRSALTTPFNMAGKVGHSLIIPAMIIRDMNNDGQNDVISRVDKITEVFLGKKDGSFPIEPSYRIDLDAIASPAKEFDLDNIDFSNLSGMINTGPQQQLEDLDGDKIEDLLLLDNGKITVYGGTATGMDLTTPRQILKSSGNVLNMYALDIDDDTLKDLFVARIQDISIGDIFTWFVFSKDITFEIYIYKNQGKQFAKRPGRKLTVTLKLPSFLKINSFMNKQKNSEYKPVSTRAVRANLFESQSHEDLLVMRANTIEGFLKAANTGLEKEQILEMLKFLGLSETNDDLTLDLEDMMQNPSESGNIQLLAVKDKQPDFKIDIIPYKTDTSQDATAVEQDIAAVDLNGDNRDDIFLLTDRDETSVAGTLFLSR